MTAHEPQPSALKRFWIGWRREILRGAALFTVVVVVGLGVRGVTSSASRSVRDAVGNAIPFGDWDVAFDAPGRQTGDTWNWRGPLKAGQRLWLRNTNGPISVEAAQGTDVELTAERSWRASDPGSVRLVAVPSADGVTICALWDAATSECGPDGRYHMNRTRRNDVAVRFTVGIPRGVVVDASTINGAVTVRGARAEVAARTVNGRIQLATTTSPVRATTVNGSVEATVNALGTTGDVTLQTVNGSVTVTLPARLDADLDAETMTGRVESDFPLSVTGRISPRHVRAVIGAGGPTLKLRTVTGSIDVRRAGEAAPKQRARAPRQPR